MTTPTLTDLNQEETHYYPLMCSLDRYIESSRSLDDLSSKMCV